jgi:hypothetical protein
MGALAKSALSTAQHGPGALADSGIGFFGGVQAVVEYFGMIEGADLSEG